MDFGWLIRVRARRRDAEAIIYVVASALARPRDFEFAVGSDSTISYPIFKLAAALGQLLCDFVKSHRGRCD
jgi:hypothetical protein